MKRLDSLSAGILLLSLVGTLAWGQPESLNETLNRSREALQASDPENALHWAEQALASHPGSPPAWKQYGRVLHLMDKSEKAIAAYETAISLTPDDADLNLWLTGLYVKTLTGDDLREKLSKVPQHQKATAWKPEQLSVGFSLVEAGNLESLAVWLSLNPPVASPQNALAAEALSQVANGDLSAADTLISASPPSLSPPLRGLLAFALGKQYLQTKQAESAVRCLALAEDALPGSRPVQREKGWALFRLKRFEEAADTWSVQTEEAPPPVEWNLWIARSRLLAGQIDLAQQAVDRFRTEHPLNVEALLLKTELLNLQHQESRIQDLLDGIQDAGLQEDIRLLTDVRSLSRAGQYAKAAERLASGLDRGSPRQGLIKQTYLELLEDWSNHTPITERWRILETRNELTPNDPGILRDLAWSYWADHQTPRALEALRASLRLGVDPFSDTLTQAMARLVEEGYTDQALELFKEFAPGETLSETAIDLFHRNRLRAAMPLLETAWQQGERGPQTGLYLSYLHAQEGRCRELADTLAPVMKQFRAQPDDETRDLMLETLMHCPENQELITAISAMPGMQDLEQPYSPRVTDLLQAYALEYVRRQQIPEARKALSRVHERDPLRPVWSLRLELAMQEKDDTAVNRLIGAAPVDELPPAERTRFQGFASFHLGRLDEAVQAFAASLEVNPEQVDLYPRVFRLYLALGQSAEADHIREKLLYRVDSGETRNAAALAEMFTLQGHSAQAADYWYMAYLSKPGSIQTISATALSLADSCRSKEALAFLQDLLPAHPDSRLFALAAEIARWTGDRVKSEGFAVEGLSLDPDHPGLLRFLAESAETRSDPDTALMYARRYLTGRPEDLSMQRVAGRSLMMLNRNEEALTIYTALRETYPDEAFPLLRLREIHTALGDTKAALEAARTLHLLAPSNAEWQRLYGASLAEHRRYRDAIQTLHPLAELPVDHAVPVLLFPQVTVCDDPGRVRIQQVEGVLRLFQEQERTSVLPGDGDPDVPKNGKRVILIFLDPEPTAVIPLKTLLDSYQVSAVWITRKEEGIPVGHSEMELSDSLPHQPASADRIEITQDAFVILPLSNARLPAFRVPATWSTEEAKTWISEENPLNRSRLTLAKVLYWHNQNQRAEYWFTQTDTTGETPFDITYNRGMNALRGGDIHLAQTELSEAARLRPEHPGVSKGLVDLRQQTRPQLTGFAHVEDDSDNRELQWAGAGAYLTLHSRLQLWASGEARRWTLEDEEENAERYLFGLQVYPTSFHRLRLQGWITALESGDDIWGGDAAYTIPSAFLRGSIRLNAGHDDVQTLGGIRREITEDTGGVHLYSRVFDNWDLFLDGLLMQRSDENDGWMTEGRLIRRLTENPYFGIGYRFKFMDSLRDDPDYYTPEDLEKHQLYFSFRNGSEQLRYSLSGEAGYAHEQTEPWDFVWSARGDVTLVLPLNFWIDVGASHLESPRYTLDTFDARIGLRF